LKTTIANFKNNQMKTSIQKPRSKLVALLTILCAGAFFAFKPIKVETVTGNEVEYDLVIETNYVLPEGLDVTTLTPLDASRLRRKAKSYHVKKEIGTNGKPISTISNITDSQLESWMPAISKIEYDEIGSRIYGANGNVINQRAYSGRELEMQEILDVDPMQFGKLRLLKQPNAQDILAMQNEGVEVSNISSTEIRMRNGNSEVIQNLDRLSVDRRFYENGQVKFRKQSKYLPTLEGLYMIPAYDIHRKQMTLPGGICVEEVTKKFYQNYRINGQNPVVTSMQNVQLHANIDHKSLKTAETKISVFPNPTTDELQVKLLGTVSQEPSSLEVINVIGQVVNRKMLEPSDRVIRVDVKDLPKGTYFVQLTQGDAKWSKRFVKQ
jgi:hypothetical protein